MRKRANASPPIDENRAAALLEYKRSVVAAALFDEYRRAPRPTVPQCYALANAINLVRNSKPASAKNNDRAYQRRRTIINSMRRLIEEQKEMHKPFDNVVLPLQSKSAEALAALEIALERGEEALLWPFDSMAGERKNAAWHKLARYIAQHVKDALYAAGRTKVSLDKRGPFVRVVVAALELTGEHRTPDAVAAALAQPPT